MTIPSRDRLALAVSDQQVEQASSVTQGFARSALSGSFAIEASDGVSITVPAELADLVREIVRAVADGKALTIAALPEELTTTVAAKELGVSRPTLMRLIADGEIPAHKVGTHTRVKTADVRRLADERLEQRRQAFNDLRRFEDEHGLGD